jgi:hypothetical protein
VPKQISTGDRTILGKISKRGNRYLRVLFVQAAWVVLIKPMSWERHGLKHWIEAAKKRLHRNGLGGTVPITARGDTSSSWLLLMRNLHCVNPLSQHLLGQLRVVVGELTLEGRPSRAIAPRQSADRPMLGQRAAGISLRLREAGWGAKIVCRAGDGTLYTRNAGDVRVFWQGPSVGFDAGADGARTMMLVYSLPQTGAIFERFGGITGSAYLVGGFGMTALTGNNIVVVPIRSGVGLRLGANLGYLKFTDSPTWNPF